MPIDRDVGEGQSQRTSGNKPGALQRRPDLSKMRRRPAAAYALL